MRDEQRCPADLGRNRTAGQLVDIGKRDLRTFAGEQK